MLRHTIMRDRHRVPVRLGGAKHGAVRTACGRWVATDESDVRHGEECLECFRAIRDAHDDIQWTMREASYERRERRRGA